MKWPEMAPEGSKAMEATPSIVSTASPPSTACSAPAGAGAGWWFPFACESDTEPIDTSVCSKTDCATYSGSGNSTKLIVYQAQGTDTTEGGRDMM
jgi:hypothetical protein